MERYGKEWAKVRKEESIKAKILLPSPHSAKGSEALRAANANPGEGLGERQVGYHSIPNRFKKLYN